LSKYTLKFFIILMSLMTKQDQSQTLK